LINLTIWIVVGAVIGWSASTARQVKNWKGLITDILTGILGAFVGGYLLSPLLATNAFSESGVGISASLTSGAGALSLLAISKLFQNLGRLLRSKRALFDDAEHF
jgi:uncharacterized membrane protein YeaQ/YmgE (transglycosylase-associated protein family)